MPNAPVVIFAYKRLDGLCKLIKSLKANVESANSVLFIFSDGPKSEKDFYEVENVRKYIDSISGFKEIRIEKSTKNKGLANSIINGVGKVFEEYNEVIVLEDDLILSPNFLSFMNVALDQYCECENVFSISGHSFNFTRPADYLPDGYFLSRGWSWGWATWKNRWEGIDWQVSDFDAFYKNRKLRSAFSKGGSDLNAMLHKQIQGRLDSWAIRWFYHQFKISGLTYYPLLSKVTNNGFDADATHTKIFQSRFKPHFDATGNKNFTMQDDICITGHFQKKFQAKMGIVSRAFSKAEVLYSKLFKR
jgi:hypothetical protein